MSVARRMPEGIRTCRIKEKKQRTRKGRREAGRQGRRTHVRCPYREVSIL